VVFYKLKLLWRLPVISGNYIQKHWRLSLEFILNKN
jgi:hypothetical protein